MPFPGTAGNAVQVLRGQGRGATASRSTGIPATLGDRIRRAGSHPCCRPPAGRWMSQKTVAECPRRGSASESGSTWKFSLAESNPSPGSSYGGWIALPVCFESFRLSTPFHKYGHVCCVDFRFWRGATREHPPKWGCDRGATKPEPKSDATLRATVLFGPDVVAHSLQTPEGYARRSRLVWAQNPSPQTWSYL